jgi:hypothetical protein
VSDAESLAHPRVFGELLGLTHRSKWYVWG